MCAYVFPFLRKGGWTRPQAEYPLKQNRDFAAAAASFFLSDQKETKESPGAAHGHLRCPTPLAPGPPFYGGVEGAPRQLRPARRPPERCLKMIAAALLKDLF